MPLTLKNFYALVPLNPISDLTVVGGDTEATIKWTDPVDLVSTTWTGTKLVRKVGSAPTSINDGTLVVLETTRNTYSSTGYTDTGLTNGTTYYYAAFAIADNGLVTISSTTPSVTPAQGGWQPGANTVAYYPLDSINTVNDLSGNNYNLTGDGAYNFGTNGGVNCCYISNGSFKVSISSIGDNGGQTVSIWYYEVSAPTYDNGVIAGFGKDNQAVINGLYRAKGRPDSKNGIVGLNWVNSVASTAVYNTNLGQWNYYCYTYYNGTGKLYVNGALVSSLLGSSTSRNLITISRYGGDPRSINGYISNAIFENKARTAQEISDYYDQTKSLYGIS